jgi:hypothetical protein
VEICPIHKKGGVKMYDNDRAVTLLCTTIIFSDILYVKSVLYAEEIT